jgi:hypothetical protein
MVRNTISKMAISKIEKKPKNTKINDKPQNKGRGKLEGK